MSVHLYMSLLLFSLCEEILPSVQQQKLDMGEDMRVMGDITGSLQAHHYYGARSGGLKKNKMGGCYWEAHVCMFNKLRCANSAETETVRLEIWTLTPGTSHTPAKCLVGRATSPE